jgi:hypothetical protein
MQKFNNFFLKMKISKNIIRVIFSTIILFSFSSINAQQLKSGTYTFNLKDAEHPNKGIVGKCKVVIKGSNIIVIYKSGNLSLKKGEIYDKGILLYHKKAKKWIIAHSPEDGNAPEVGGCSDGPKVIHFFKAKEIENC